VLNIKRWIIGLSCAFAVATSGFAADPKKPITKPKYDPDAPRVEMFDGIEDKSLQVTLRPDDEFGGNLFVKNLMDHAVTVVLPDAMVGIQVHPQFGNLQGGAQGQNGFGNNGAGAGAGAGQNQTVGGGPGQGQTGAGQGQQFFSIPAAATVKWPMNSVCLEHGKPAPTSRNTYRVARVEEFSDKPELADLCRQIGAGQLERSVAQAAGWHLGSGMSWEELAQKQQRRVAASSVPYFSRSQIQQAHEVVQQSIARTKDADLAPKSTSSASPAR
jgi:hypothetical protein